MTISLLDRLKEDEEQKANPKRGISLLDRVEQPPEVIEAPAVEVAQPERGILDLAEPELLTGGLEAAVSLGTGAVGAIVGGLGGLAAAPFLDPTPSGGTRVGDVATGIQEALTFKPRTQGGQVIARQAGEAVAATGLPQGLQFIEEALGDTGFSLGGPVVGAIATAIPTAILEFIGLKGISKARGAKKIVGVPDEVEASLKKSGISLDDLSDANVEQIQIRTAEQIKAQEGRIKTFQEQGLTPTRAQVTRDAGEFQTQQELAKTQTGVRDLLEEQEGLLTDRFNEKISGTGGQPVTSGSSVTDTVVNRSTKLDNEISDLYNQARDAAAGEKNVKLNKTGKILKDLAPSDRRAGGNISAIVGDLQAKGVMDENFKIVGKIDVTTAEDVRQLANSLFDSQNGFGNQKLREIKQAIDDDVLIVAGEDVFKQGRKAKSEFEKGLSRARVSKFDERKSNLVRDVLENKIDSNGLAQKITQSKSYRAEDLDQLKRYLTQDDAGKAAFDDLRAEVMKDIKEASFIGPEDARGNKALSRNALEKTLNKIGKPRLSILFNAQERAFLDQMLKISKLREPVRGTALGKGPSAQAVQSLERNIIKNPLLNDLFRGLTQTLGEGVRSRGALRLPGSAAEVKTTIRALPAAATTVAPTLIREQE